MSLFLLYLYYLFQPAPLGIMPPPHPSSFSPPPPNLRLLHNKEDKMPRDKMKIFIHVDELVSQLKSIHYPVTAP